MKKNSITSDKKSSLESERVRQIRAKVGMTQAEVAQALGVSIRAIQSYEQGWREVPTHIMVQMLVLAAAHHTLPGERKSCWEITGCPSERQAKCPCRRTDGRLCWLVSGRLCSGLVAGDGHDLQRCMNCPVIQQILS